LKYRAMRLRCL
jgi:hypothetical protein